MLSWSRQSSWWGDIQLFTNVRWLWVYGRISFSTFVRDSLGPIGGNFWDIEKKYYQNDIDKQNYKPAVEISDLNAIAYSNIE
jgi:hypothetical protein